jgi:glycosyltransferase involved in cell wall biosynthesis
MNPQKVSVVVAARNEEEHLSEALHSILVQEYVQLELIFIDDNSTDSTYSIAVGISHSNNKIRVFKNPKNGKCSAFNFGILQATGEYVCIFAGDDIMPPGSLAIRVGEMKKCGAAASMVVLSKILSFSNDKRFDGILTPRRKGAGALSGSSPLMTRKIANTIFPVPEHLPNEDTWMELAILYLPGIELRHLDVISCMWRVHAGNSINMSSSYKEFNAKISLRMTALSIFSQRFGHLLDPAKRRHLNSRIECEDARVKNSIILIMLSKVGLLDKLRALSTANRFFYAVRVSAFKALSGW